VNVFNNYGRRVYSNDLITCQIVTNGELKFYINYRKSNVLIKKNQYPLLLIDKILKKLRKTRIFTKLNIR